jgi:Uma2 family endonuclease
MSTTLELPLAEAVSTQQERPYLFSVEEFYRVLDNEIFPDEAKVWLWEGRIYQKMAKSQAHAVAGINVTMTLARSLPSGWCLSSENPITIGPNKAPLPDMVVLRGVGDNYLDRRPSVDDIGLVVELSVSSLKFDTGAKLTAYASAGIPAYWVVNLIDGLVLVHTNPIPAEGRYASVATVKRGETFPFLLGGTEVGPIAASDLLPAR